MPELRKDPISGRWVIIATDRARRPYSYRTDGATAPDGLCPFCPGHESKTPPEVLAYRPLTPDGATGLPNGPGWTVRAFPNRAPALMIEGQLDRAGEGVYDRMNGIGAHEVLVETPDHRKSFSDLSEAESAQVFSAYRDRMLDLKRDLRFRYVMVFKNHGVLAGASLEHSHSQLIALPIVPINVREEMAGAQEYYRYKERCVFCDIVRQEVQDRSRLVYENDGFLVLEPFAPKFPFETWLLPRTHRSSYEECPPTEYGTLANAMRVALRKLRHSLDDPP
jgi:UDPglucose--hexose-1-phosphate uridylyltransferase